MTFGDALIALENEYIDIVDRLREAQERIAALEEELESAQEKIETLEEWQE